MADKFKWIFLLAGLFLLSAVYLIVNKDQAEDLPVFGPPNHTLPSFQFVDQDGKIAGSKEVNGKIIVADFFFTRCGSICPLMTSQLTRVQDAYRSNTLVHILSFTVDPDYDSSDILYNYMVHYNADPNAWTMYTGEKKELYDLARKGFMLTVDDGDGGPEDFIHSEQLVLVDPNRRIRGYYDGTDSSEVDRLIVDIKNLVGIFH
ncbi:MAG: SCO family protein [Chitinophagales bacterium]|nr:SCO family protein [Chitinophagales bacterium]